MKHISFVILSIFAIYSLATCGKSSKKAPEKSVVETVEAKEVVIPAATIPGSVKGLSFILENGPGAHGASGVTPYTPGTPLPDAETTALLAKLPKGPGTGNLAKSFAMRDRSLPPPRTGATVQSSFPPPQKPAPTKKPDAGELTVLRTSPTTDVYIAPNISVTFSQPMVAVTSHADSIAKGVPVKISPEVAGKWRWLGTKTLVFESELERLPKSTKYVVTIAEGIKSALGKKLAKEVKWEFSTPTLSVETFYPQHGPQNLNPMFYVRFDQRVDPELVMKSLTMKSSNSVNVPVRLATQEEIKKDKTVSHYMEYGKTEFKGRQLAFIPLQQLEKATYYTISIGPGTPSMEGPKKTDKAITYSIKTYDPLAIEDQSCKQRYKCRPPWSMSMRFNNGLDEKAFKKEWVTVTPAIPDLSIIAAGRSIIISGHIKGRRDYEVTVSPLLKDIYNQTLGSKQTRTFYYREAYPALNSNYRRLTVGDPGAPPEVRFQSVNIPTIKAEVYAVGPEDYPGYLDYSRKYRYDKKAPAPPGKLVLTKTWSFDGKSDEMVETVLSLKKLVNKAGNGQFMVQVSSMPIPEKRYQWKTFITWIQFTKLGLDAHFDHKTLYGLVTDLATGNPVSGAKVEILSGPTGQTDKEGLARLELPSSIDSPLGSLLVAKTGNDISFVPKTMYSYYGSYGKYLSTGAPGSRAIYFTFDDRKLYKPKETVNLKGWIRIADMGPAAGLSLPDGATEVTYTVYDPRNNKIGNGKAAMNKLGGFHFNFTLPDNTNLGSARVEMRTNAGNRGSHYFTIAEFRKPEFEVSISASEGPFLLGERADLTIGASYFSGGGLPGAEVSWSATASPGHFSPAGLWKWSFGNQAVHWWFLGGGSSSNTTSKYLSGATDSRGKHSVRLSFKEANPQVPYSVSTNASVVDVNRQSWTARKTLLVHPADRYVGLKTDKYFVPRGVPLKVDFIVTDLEGKKVSQVPVTITAQHEKWKYHRGKYQRVHTTKQECRVMSDAKAPGSCTFKTEKGGSYRITATIHDAKGRKNSTSITRWVSGGSLPPVRKVEREKVQLILDKKEYKPGDTAEVFIQAPFSPAQGLWFVKHAGIASAKRFTMNSPTHILKVPLTAAHMPATEIQVELVGVSKRMDDGGQPVPKAPPRPAFAGATIRLPVSLASQKLHLTITPVKTRLMPGGSTRVDMQVLDWQKKPVEGAEIALVAVDEAVLALTGYRVGDPIGYFYPTRIGNVQSRWIRQQILLDDPVRLTRDLNTISQSKMSEGSLSDSMALPASAPGAVGGRFSRGSARPKRARSMDRMKSKKESLSADEPEEKAHSNDPTVKVRSNFAALALFAPEVSTDAQGKASVELKLPDNLTRYRLMAVVVAKATHYGKAESQVTARLPLQLRPSPPRFLNFGDSFELPLVVQNQTSKPLEVSVALRGHNVVLKGPAG
ncbi:Ig-like domain-containing protein, partial [Myxococcota bacterium]|nr:Ig-like domain-containing protein [Myxococcota bacterium]